MEETFEILYNKCYGMFGLSDKARKEYLTEESQDNFDHCHLFDYCPHSFEFRTDKHLINVFLKLGPQKMSGGLANICIATVPLRYKPFFYFTECDGLEEVCVDYSRYLLSEIHKISLDNTRTKNTENRNFKQRIQKIK